MGVSTATLDELLNDLIRKKKAEREANLARIAAEQALLACLDERPERGSAKLEGTHVRATAKFGLNYKADVAGMRNVEWPDTDVGLPLEKIPESYEFDARAYEALRVSHPKLAAKLAAFVTTTPAKPSVELKL